MPTTADVIQFPVRQATAKSGGDCVSVPAGAQMAGLLLKNLKALNGIPSERSMVDDDGNLVQTAIERVARWRALHEYRGYIEQFGQVMFPLGELIRKERKLAQEEAEGRAKVIKARREFEGLPLTERLIRSLEWELYRAENGLAGPYDAHKVQQLKLQIAAYRFPMAAE